MAIKRREPEAAAGAPAWMSTYGDLVTLLLCFFVLLFAMSTLDVQKFQEVVIAFSGREAIIQGAIAGGNGIDDLSGSGIMEMPDMDFNVSTSKQEQAERDEQAEKAEKAMEELKEMASDFKTYFAENNLKDKVDVNLDDTSVTLVFREGILFDSGKADLKSSAIEVLDIVVNEIFKYPDNMIEIEGHTDTVPMHTAQFPSNWHLSSYRAVSVLAYFVDEKGIDTSRVSAVGKGEYSPIATNDTVEGRSLNRRVEIRFKSKYYSNTDAIQ